MCIAAFVWQSHPLYPLILLQNRDEYHNRPTKEVGWWDDEEEGKGEILGGRDEMGGGTWLGCSRQGRVAFLTNVLELHPSSDAATRGDLPLLFLKGTKSPMEFGQELAKEAHHYNGFNLIVADIPSRSMVYISNRPKGESVAIQEVVAGVHVLSNAKLDSPWPKVQRLEHNFKKMLSRYWEGEVPVKEMAEKLMKDRVKAEESRLPGICDTDWEYNLSSVFVEVDTPLGRYGTRSTAALAVRDTGEVVFYEKYLEKGEWKEHELSYFIQKPKWTEA
ncbi:PREDICTED: transport and Golgi organization 2 homolog [Tarenaya hassleriana]|uniref:transport and Golgi organization 2 homolog n=1 Tax=Tarenaya hassleriana TaxID=28532 RepID=UPI00053C71B7|nr:PREDICTED: transport and Golgi organization 2 homolog [Tarenaya hassleriana]